MTLVFLSIPSRYQAATSLVVPRIALDALAADSTERNSRTQWNLIAVENALFQNGIPMCTLDAPTAVHLMKDINGIGNNTTVIMACL